MDCDRDGYENTGHIGGGNITKDIWSGGEKKLIGIWGNYVEARAKKNMLKMQLSCFLRGPNK
jgi:hypothetical protein